MRIVFVFFACLWSLTVAAQTLVKFSNDSIPFTASYPSNWEQKVKAGKRIFFTSPKASAMDDFRENVNIGNKEGKGFTCGFLKGEVEKSIMENLQKSFDDFKLEKKSHYKFNGCEALEISYTVIMKDVLPDARIRIRQIMFGKNGVLWTITYTSKAGSNAFDEEGEAIMKSVVVK